jgi:hypothetical protein
MMMALQKGEIMSSDPNFADDGLLRRFKDQLLIVMLKRLGGEATLPLSEIDATGMDLLAFQLKENAFHLTLRKMS